MPEEVKIAIKSEYDANGANRAKQDLRQLSQDIPASLNKTEKALAGVSRATADLSPQADRAAASLSKIKAPDAPVQASASWKSLLTNISRGADSGTLSLSGLSGAALRFTSLSAGFAGVSVAMQGVNKALMQVGERFSAINGVAADSSSLFSNVFTAASDYIGETLGNFAANNLDPNSGIAKTIANIATYNTSKQRIAQAEAEQKQLPLQGLEHTVQAYQRTITQGVAAARETRDTTQQIAQDQLDAANLKADVERQAAADELSSAQNRITLEQAQGEISATRAEQERAAAQKLHAERLSQINQQAESAKVQYAAALHSAAEKYNEDLVQVMADPRLDRIKSNFDRYYSNAREAFPKEALALLSSLNNSKKALKNESDKAAADLDSSDTALATAKQRENIAKQQAQVEVETAKAAALEAEANNRRATINKALADIAANHKTSQSYAAQSATSEAQRIDADRQALERRKYELLQLRKTPNLSQDSIASINAALRATNAEINGFKEHYGRMRVASQKDLQNLQFPDLKTTNRTLNGNLRSLERAYSQTAKRLERSASRGDEKGVQKALDSMAKRAAQIEQITGNTGKVLDMYNRAKDQAAIIQATSQKDGLTADQLRDNQIRQGFGRKPRYTPKKPQTTTEERAQYSSLQPASNAAAKAAQNAQKTSQDLQALTSSLSALADATSSSNSSLASAIKSCQDAIKKINSNISTIRTKL